VRGRGRKGILHIFYLLKGKSRIGPEENSWPTEKERSNARLRSERGTVRIDAHLGGRGTGCSPGDLKKKRPRGESGGRKRFYYDLKGEKGNLGVLTEKRRG